MSSPTQHSQSIEWHTPQTSRVRTLIFDAQYSYRRQREVTGIAKSTAWDIVHGSSARRIGHDLSRQETRGSKKKLTREDVARCDQLLETAGFDGKTLTWEMLAYEANLNVSPWTMKREMHQLNWWKCIACRKSYVSPDHAKRRVNWAEEALFLRPNDEDWDNVRFSDEMHAVLALKDVYVLYVSSAHAIVQAAYSILLQNPKKRKMLKESMFGLRLATILSRT